MLPYLTAYLPKIIFSEASNLVTVTPYTYSTFALLLNLINFQKQKKNKNKKKVHNRTLNNSNKFQKMNRHP